MADEVHARLNTIGEFPRHPVLSVDGRWRRIETPGGPVRALVPPLRLGDFEPRMGPVPAVGEHTDAILAELGLDEGQITRLRQAGTI